MTRLTERTQTSITVDGTEYPLNTSFRNALVTWDALQAAHDGDISPLAAAYASGMNMLGVDITDFDEDIINAMLVEIVGYLHKYSRVSTVEKQSARDTRPLLDLEQDATMLFDAFQSMGVDLDTQDITYPRFMSLLRELPKNAQICRIIYLRQQRRAGKLTKEERAECRRRGWEIINLRNRQAEKAAADNSEHFKNIREMQLAKIEECTRDISKFVDGVCNADICIVRDTADRPRCKLRY